ncbi:hypothetical protein RI054_35g134140 [Pseudoscourfieldia marina]
MSADDDDDDALAQKKAATYIEAHWRGRRVRAAFKSAMVQKRKHHGLARREFLMFNAQKYWKKSGLAMHTIEHITNLVRQKSFDAKQRKFENKLSKQQDGSTITHTVDDEEALMDLDYRHQGDADAYTAEALLTRQALRKDPEICKGIRKWWDTFDVEEPKDTMSIHDYAHMHFLLDISMHEMGFNLPDDQLLADVLEDWAEDCMGAPTMTYDAFEEAIFELTDLWTYTTERREYVNFLKDTLEKALHITDNKPKLEKRLERLESKAAMLIRGKIGGAIGSAKNPATVASGSTLDVSSTAAATVASGSTLNVSSTAAATVTSGSTLGVTVATDATVSAGGDVSMTSTGKTTVTSTGSDISVSAPSADAKVSITSSGSTTVTSGDDVDVIAEDAVTITSGEGGMRLQSTGQLAASCNNGAMQLSSTTGPMSLSTGAGGASLRPTAQANSALGSVGLEVRAGASGVDVDAASAATVTSDASVSMTSAAFTTVASGSTLDVSSTAAATVASGSTLNVSSTAAATVTSGSTLGVTVATDATVSAGGDVSMTSTGKTTVTSTGSDISVSAPSADAKVSITSSGSTTVTSGDDVDVIAEDAVTITSGEGGMRLQSTGQLAASCNGAMQLSSTTGPMSLSTGAGGASLRPTAQANSALGSVGGNGSGRLGSGQFGDRNGSGQLHTVLLTLPQSTQQGRHFLRAPGQLPAVTEHEYSGASRSPLAHENTHTSVSHPQSTQQGRHFLRAPGQLPAVTEHEYSGASRSPLAHENTHTSVSHQQDDRRWKITYLPNFGYTRPGPYYRTTLAFDSSSSHTQPSHMRGPRANGLKRVPRELSDRDEDYGDHLKPSDDPPRRVVSAAMTRPSAVPKLPELSTIHDEQANKTSLEKPTSVSARFSFEIKLPPARGAISAPQQSARQQSARQHSARQHLAASGGSGYSLAQQRIQSARGREVAMPPSSRHVALQTVNESSKEPNSHLLLFEDLPPTLARAPQISARRRPHGANPVRGIRRHSARTHDLTPRETRVH